ncbi:MAG: Wzz/FepE/Etk N-terminal domain-containing protein [Nitrospirota bacterium]|nr:Wzz/FepE/Etk N-terminal domain-containing protein [Nitrospirota bacterium]
MQDNIKSIFPEDEEERTLLDYWRVLVKRKLLIIILVLVSVFATAIISLFETNIYQSKAVIAPVSDKGGKGRRLAALASQLSGMPRITLPGSASSSEIIALLNSNILREKIIRKYNLLPVLFDEQWDEGKKEWKKDDSFNFNPFKLIGSIVKVIRPEDKVTSRKEEEEGIPSIWDGLRAFDNMVRVNDNIKNNTIVISVDFYDPEEAAAIVEDFLTTLNSHMSEEAKRVANTNRKYLEDQLKNTSDPFIKQKIYNLIAHQVETSMMAEVKENFAFKVLDPPMVPDRKIKPKRSLMVMLSFLLSLFAGIFLAFFLENIERAKNKDRDKDKEVHIKTEGEDV